MPDIAVRAINAVTLPVRRLRQLRSRNLPMVPPAQVDRALDTLPGPSRLPAGWRPASPESHGDARYWRLGADGLIAVLVALVAVLVVLECLTFAALIDALERLGALRI